MNSQPKVTKSRKWPVFLGLGFLCGLGAMAVIFFTNSPFLTAGTKTAKEIAALQWVGFEIIEDVVWIVGGLMLWRLFKTKEISWAYYQGTLAGIAAYWFFFFPHSAAYVSGCLQCGLPLIWEKTHPWYQTTPHQDFLYLTFRLLEFRLTFHEIMVEIFENILTLAGAAAFYYYWRFFLPRTTAMVKEKIVLLAYSFVQVERV